MRIRTIEKRLASFLMIASIAPGVALETNSAAQKAPELHVVPQLELQWTGPFAFDRTGTVLLDSNRVWDLASHKIVRTLPSRAGFTCVDLAADGKTVAGVERDSVGLFNLQSGSLTRRIEPHSGPIVYASFTQGGTQLIVVCNNGKLFTFGVQDAAPMNELTTGFNDIVCATRSAAGNLLAVGGKSEGKAAVSLVDLSTHVHRLMSEPSLTAITSVAVDPAGTRACAAYADGMVVWNTATGEVTGRIANSGVVRYTQDGKYLLNLRQSVGSLGNTIDILDARTLQRKHTMPETWGIRDVQADAQGQYVAAGAFGGVSLYDLESGKSIGYLSGSGKPVTAHAFTHSGDLMAISTGSRIIVWSLKTARVVWTTAISADYGVTMPGEVTSLVFSRGDDVLYACTSNGVRSYKAGDGAELRTLSKTSDAKPNTPDYYSTYYTHALLTGRGDRLIGLRTLLRFTDPSALMCCKADIWDTQTGQRLGTFGDEMWQPVTLPNSGVSFLCVALSADGSMLAVTRSGVHRVEIWDVAVGKRTREIACPTGEVRALAFSPKEALLAVGLPDGEVQLWRSGADKPEAVLRLGRGGIINLSFTLDGKQIIAACEDFSVVVSRIGQAGMPTVIPLTDPQSIGCPISVSDTHVALADSLYELTSFTREATLTPTTSGGVVATTPDGYYTAARDALSAVGFRVGDRAYRFEQFDLILNRPDKVLAACKSSDAAAIALYHSAALARLAAGNGAELMPTAIEAPTVSISGPPTTPDRTYTISVSAESGSKELSRLAVLDNGVPIPIAATGSKMDGGSIAGRHTRKFHDYITVELSSGENRLEVSAFDTGGIESIRQPVTVACTAESHPRRYVVAIGVSEYISAENNLKSADKDASAIAAAFAVPDGPMPVTILNKAATFDEIMGVKAALAGSKPDDVIVLFFAGHGDIGQDGAYYFCPNDMDFHQPKARGITYADMLSLINGIGARHKLLLIDSCFSGGREGAPRAAGNGPGAGRSTEKITASKQDRVFEMEEDLFADLRHFSGATVIAASRGSETAGESVEHGVFTQCVLDGMKGAADLRHAGSILTSDLFAYVAKEVARRTQNQQRPITREENLNNDFALTGPGISP